MWGKNKSIWLRPEKNLHPLFWNGQIEAVRMTGAESNLLLLIIVGKVLFSHFPCSRGNSASLNLFSRAEEKNKQNPRQFWTLEWRKSPWRKKLHMAKTSSDQLTASCSCWKSKWRDSRVKILVHESFSCFFLSSTSSNLDCAASSSLFHLLVQLNLRALTLRSPARSRSTTTLKLDKMMHHWPFIDETRRILLISFYWLIFSQFRLIGNDEGNDRWNEAYNHEAMLQELENPTD